MGGGGGGGAGAVVGEVVVGKNPASATPRVGENKAATTKNRKSCQAAKTKTNEKQNPDNVKMEESYGKEMVAATSAKDRNVSSCVIELKVVWFNFAAPPRTPITRKIDYTRLVGCEILKFHVFDFLLSIVCYFRLFRLDWNLLSTASPAINAWMNPSNRLAIRVVHMVRSMYRRSTAIVACLMTEALDMQGVHISTKVVPGNDCEKRNFLF